MFISNDLKGSILNRFLGSLFSSVIKTLSYIIHGLRLFIDLTMFSLDYEKKNYFFSDG